jgi:hypothetical protein
MCRSFLPSWIRIRFQQLKLMRIWIHKPGFAYPTVLILLNCHIVSRTRSRGVEPDTSVGNVGLHLDVIGLDFTARLAFHMCVG